MWGAIFIIGVGVCFFDDGTGIFVSGWGGKFADIAENQCHPLTPMRQARRRDHTQ
jgi:hypothetical protein